MSETERAAPVAADHSASAREAPAGLFDRLRALFGLGPASVRDDLEDALVGAGADADFNPQERAILTNVLGLHDVRVEDVMVPRADIIALGIDAPLGEVLSLFRTAGHSRLPVHGETLDDPRGMVHIRDFVDYLAAEHSIDDFLEQYPTITKEQAIGALDELKKTLLEVRESFTR